MKISEVASRAGVSTATVSRVLNHPDMVNKETLERILRLVKELDYTPNPVAQTLMTGKTSVAGLIVPNLLNPFIAQFVLGVEELLMGVGYTALICNTHEDMDRERFILKTLAKRAVDGFIWAYPHHFTPELVKNPLVVVGPIKTNRYDKVAIDEVNCVNIVADRLVRQGHTKIGVIIGDMRFPISKIRLRLFKNALIKRGIKLDQQFIAEGSYFSMESGYDAMGKLLQCEKLPSVIFAFNDMLAIGAIKRLIDQKINVPEDISFAEQFSPALTTVRASGFKLGERAAELLISRINNPEATIRSVKIPVELVVRQSN